MKIVLIGGKKEQSSKFGNILENIQNCEIHFTNKEKNLYDQIEKIKQLNKNQLAQDINVLFEINKSNISLQQKVISELKNTYKLYPPFILLFNDDQAEEQAIIFKNQLNRYTQVQICNLKEYFEKNYGYDKLVDLNGQKIAMIISKEQDIKNKIFQTIKQTAILENKWALINTPQFDMKSDIEQKKDTINELRQIFKRYQSQISLLFIIVDYERDDLTKKSFNNIYSYLRQFSNRIILLIYNRLDEDFEENSKLYNYFIKSSKIREVYSLSNNQLQNQSQINEYFNKILKEQQYDLEIGIDMKDTIFEMRDERESQIEKQIIQEDFQKATLQQLEQSIDHDDQQIKLYQQKIAEIERSKQQKLNQIREIKLFYKQKRCEKSSQETQIQTQFSINSDILQQQASQIKNQNQVIVDIKDSQTLKKQIQHLQTEKESIQRQLQECQYNLNDKNRYKSKQQEQEQLLQIQDLKNKIGENDLKTREYNNQLEQLQSDIKKDSYKFESTNYVYNSQSTNDNTDQIYKSYCCNNYRF